MQRDRTRISWSRSLAPSVVLAFGVIGGEHAYHWLSLGGGGTARSHAAHVLRDGLLAVPLAFAALSLGLLLMRRRSAPAQAACVSLVLGLLLVPAAAVHRSIDGTFGAGGRHAHESVGWLEHGLRDASVAQAIAVPLLLLILWSPRRGGRARVRRGLPLWMRVAAPTAASVLVLLALAGSGILRSGDRTAAATDAGEVVHDYRITDTPGPWFDTGTDIGGTRSLAVAQPGDSVRFKIARPASETVHTVTSLLWPTGAPRMPFDQPEAFRGKVQTRLTTPGLYVFVCKLHPFMLGATIVDDPATPELDIGRQASLVNGLRIPTASDLGLRLVRAFFNITNPANYQVYSSSSDTTWDPSYPPVPVRAYDQSGSAVSIPNLDAFLGDYFREPVTLPKAAAPSVKGVGEVWVDTQYELTSGKSKPGAATAIDTSSWNVTKKFALPSLNFNNGHNLWATRDQSVLYNTEWFGTSLAAFNRRTGEVISELEVGEAPAHVMTRSDTDQVHTTLNGEDSVVEASPLARRIDRRIALQRPGEQVSHPHAHWMGPDGKTMATPNANSADSTLINVHRGSITSKLRTGLLPIAAGMMPDASKYYVSNYLDSTISVVDMRAPQRVTKTINLLANYDPIAGGVSGPIGGLPIQTPVSPNGKWAIQGNTLTSTITIIDTATDTLVKSLPCDAGCHGVNFGAKEGGGYLAYVSSKFANAMIVVDPDPNGDGSAEDARIVGRVVLHSRPDTRTDDRVTGNAGMGGQGVLPVPNVYNGWVQKLPARFKSRLTCAQRNPIGQACHEVAR